MKLSKIVLKVFFSTQNFCGQRSAVALKKDGAQIVRLCHCQPNSLIEINFKKLLIFWLRLICAVFIFTEKLIGIYIFLLAMQVCENRPSKANQCNPEISDSQLNTVLVLNLNLFG